MCMSQQFMAQVSLLDFPAELITLIKQRPNSSRIMRSAAAFDLPIFSACSAWARRHSQVASATSLVTNVKGSLKQREIYSLSAKPHNAHNSRAGQLFRTRTDDISSHCFQEPLDNQQGVNKPQLQPNELMGHCAVVPASTDVHFDIDFEMPRYTEQFSSFYYNGSSKITPCQ